ncbi:MAG: response regulator [Candidatus Zixiibacteriota bacterium]|nr:MAG: response regulator [candidate division Zixibacteria bacterium]
MKRTISILVVDDQEMMRNLLEKILAREGYRILTAGDGREAMKILRKEEVNLVISDMKMPKMDGFELLRRVKEKHPNVGVIIMTAYGDTYTVKDALLLGADEYVTKPFKSYEITMVVERAYWRLLSSNSKAELPAD